MRIQEVVQPLLEMAFDRKIVEQKVRGREETINEHLVKLLAFTVPEPTRLVWKKEIARHYRFMAALRLKPKQSLVPLRDWQHWLYDDAFVGNEAGYVQALIAMNADDFERNDRPEQEIGGAIKVFHEVMCQSLARGEANVSLIPT